ncbi:MAG: AraC family transcriptional regulator [Anaerocolumna sp.]
MKKSFRKKKYLKKMVLSYTFLVSLTTFILTIFFYQNYSEALIKKLYADYQGNLRKNARTLTDLYSEEEQLYTTLVIDNQVEKYSSLNEFDPAENYLTFLTAKKLLNINPYLHSICIYNNKAEDGIFCGSREFDLQTGLKRLKEKKSKTIFVSELSDDKNAKLLTFAYPVYTDTYEELAGGIFLNFDYERVVKHVLGETDYTQLVVDEANQILLEMQYGDDNLTRKSILTMCSGLNKRKMQAGSDRIVFDGTDYVFSYYTEASSGIKFISYTKYNDVTKMLMQQRNFFLLASLFVMLASAFVQYMVSRRLYRPIGTLTAELENSKFARETGKDEFELILHVYENAVSEIETLEEKNALYLPKLRAEMIKNILTGDDDIDQLEEKLREHGWSIPFKGMFIASIKIEECFENSLKLVVVQARMKQLLQIHLESFYTESTFMDNNEVVCLINTIKDNNMTFANLVSALEQVKNIITEEYRIKITIGLDGMVTDIRQCSNVYKKVKELQNYKYVFGYNQVIYPKCVMELLPEPLTYPDKIMAEILSCMIHNERVDFNEKLDDFMATIRQYTYPAAAMIFSKLYLEATFRSQQLGMNGMRMAGGIASDMFPKTLDEGKNKMYEVFEDFRFRKEEAEQIKSNKHYKKIEESKDYIKKNYMNPNLNVDMIAELYGYSANYFARIFKGITGFYINDYIRQVRIMKAQELLLQSDMTIVDIATATGFTTSNYFYSIFKKETGLTPAAYRNVKD